MEYIYPVADYLTITQGFSKTKPHLGMDFGWCSAYCNQAIIAAEDGVVYERADGWGNTYPSKKIYGNYVILKHANGDYTVYGHMMKGIPVIKGQTVRKGQIVGYMGNTGYSQGQHLHFELRKGGYSKINYAVDPLEYLAVEDRNLIVSDKTLFPGLIQYRKTTIGTPVPRNSKVDQLLIISEVLRARKTPSTSGEVLGYATPGWYNVTDRTEANGYKWFQVEDFWVAQDADRTWCKYFPKADPKYNVNIYDLTATQLKAIETWCDAEGVKYDSAEA